MAASYRANVNGLHRKQRQAIGERNNDDDASGHTGRRSPRIEAAAGGSSSHGLEPGDRGAALGKSGCPRVTLRVSTTVRRIHDDAHNPRRE